MTPASWPPSATTRDVDLRRPDPDGRRYIFELEAHGVTPNPLYSSRASGLTVEGVPDLRAGTIQTVAGSSREIAAQGFFALVNMDSQGRFIVDALIRLNRADEAVPLINRTRVANGQRPPVTVAGPPDDANCVPRKVMGACGSLWDALMHERNLENMAIESATMWWDFRGLNRLMEGTPVHFPVSGIELENLGLPLYTFGGVGGKGAAPKAQYHRCPVALARCD